MDLGGLVDYGSRGNIRSFEVPVLSGVTAFVVPGLRLFYSDLFCQANTCADVMLPWMNDNIVNFFYYYCGMVRLVAFEDVQLT